MPVRATRAALGALAFLSALLLGSARASADTDERYSTDLALGLVAGHAWADGWIEDGVYHYRGPDPLRRQFREAAEAAGGRWRAAGQATRVVGLDDLGLVTHGSLTNQVLTGSRNLRLGVIVGMVQCEGSNDGLVWDNPTRATAESVVRLFATVGIEAHIRGDRFFRVYVEQHDFDFFRTLPFASRARVPGA